MDVAVKNRWLKLFGMAVVFMWLTAHVVGAQFLVDYAKSYSVNGSKWWVVMQYFFITLQFLVGAVAWDVLKKLKDAQIIWGDLINTVGKIFLYIFVMSAFYISAYSVSATSPIGSVVFVVAFLWCDWKLAKEYIFFMAQIKKGMGTL